MNARGRRRRARLAPIEDARYSGCARYGSVRLTRPWNDPAPTSRWLEGSHAAVLGGRDGGAIVATAMVGQKAIAAGYYVATHPSIAAMAWPRHNGRRRGLARQTGIEKLQ